MITCDVMSFHVMLFYFISHRITRLSIPALVGAIVGAEVEGAATGELDGADDTLGVPMTFLITLLKVSAMYIVPEDMSIATLYG